MAKASFTDIEKMLKSLGGRKISEDETGGAFVLPLGGEPDKGWGVTTLHEAQIATLREAVEDYHNLDRFAVGDIVTPKGISGTKGAGQPYIVVEVRGDIEPLFTRDADTLTSARSGTMPNIRVMTHVENETVACFWGEAWEYEHYNPKTHGKGK